MDLKKIWLLAIGHLSCDINSHALPALLPYLAAAHDFDYRTCGLLAFSYSAISSLIQPAFGLLADKVTKGWFVPLGILMAGMGFGLTGFLSHELALFAVLLIAGMGAAIFHPEGARYANIVSGDRKGLGLSIFALGGNGGMVMGPLLIMLAVGGLSFGGVTLGGFGLPGTAVFCLIGLVMSFLLFRSLHAWDIAPATLRKAGGTSGENDWKAFAILMGCMLSRSAVGAGFTTYLPLYWKNVFGQTAEVGSMVLVLYCLFGVAGNLFGGTAADRWGFRRVVRVSTLLMVPCIAVFPFISNPWLAALLLAPMAVSQFAPYSSLVVLGQRYLAKNMGLASGFTLGVAVSIGGMLAPIIGWTADLCGSLAPAMHLLTPIALAGAVCAMILRPVKEA